MVRAFVPVRSPAPLPPLRHRCAMPPPHVGYAATGRIGVQPQIAEKANPRRPVLDTGLGFFLAESARKEAKPRIKCGATSKSFKLR